MKPIRLLLGKFDNLLPADFAIKGAISRAIESVTNIKISVESVSVAGETVFLKTTPAAKSEILLRQSQILRQLDKDLSVARRPQRIV